MKTIYSVKCEVVENEFCPYAKGEYVFSRLTPSNMCTASFAAIWPFANAMRHSETTGFEDSEGSVTVSCPDGWVQFRLSRIISENQSQRKDGKKAACGFR
jgi:uncharacterized repeat protein (TIGR04076 family)